ncbi:MAG TPA: hypothetical protein ENH85_00335 [Candidatus Scalindua sp.]|nr:hypothetical protein [Candidatus Scalindua sp.]
MRRYFVDYPEEGWNIKGKNLLPPPAFIDGAGWLNHYLTFFPNDNRLLRRKTVSEMVSLFVKTLNRRYKCQK